MNPIHAIGRMGWHHCSTGQRPVASVITPPAAVAPASPRRARLLSWADPPLPPGWRKYPPLPGPAPVHAALADGMPAWQIIVIAAPAALLAAAPAVTAYRMRAARRRVTPPPPETRPSRPHPPHAN